MKERVYGLSDGETRVREISEVARPSSANTF